MHTREKFIEKQEPKVVLAAAQVDAVVEQAFHHFRLVFKRSWAWILGLGMREQRHYRRFLFGQFFQIGFADLVFFTVAATIPVVAGQVGKAVDAEF